MNEEINKIESVPIGTSLNIEGIKEEEYVLAYGFRRFTACKKLGWKTIPAYIQKENKLIEVPLDNIYIVDNTRINDSSEGFLELMGSIKDNGLLQPIGVWKAQDLTRIDFLVTNLLENIQRKDISPFELAKAVKELKEHGLNEKEIAVRLSIPYSRIESLRGIVNKFSPEVVKESSFMVSDRRNIGGRLSVTTLNKIGKLRINKDETKELVSETKKSAYSSTDIDLIGALTSSGLSMSKAIKEKDKYLTIRAVIIMRKDVLDTLNYDISKTALINAMLSGKLPLKKDLFFFEKEVKSKKE